VLDKILTGTRMNSEYFTTNILTRPEEKYSQREKLRMQKAIVQMDNCSTHTSRATEDYTKQNNITRLRHLPYSVNEKLAAISL
jgi:hypothetical protein